MIQIRPIKILPWNVSNWNSRKSMAVKLLGSCEQPHSQPCESSQSAQQAMAPTWRETKTRDRVAVLAASHP